MGNLFNQPDVKISVDFILTNDAIKDILVKRIKVCHHQQNIDVRELYIANKGKIKACARIIDNKYISDACRRQAVTKMVISFDEIELSGQWYVTGIEFVAGFDGEYTKVSLENAGTITVHEIQKAA